MPLTRLLPLLALTLAGCVAQSKFDDLKQQYDDAQAELAERDKEVKSLQEALAEEQKRAADLGTEIEATRANVAKLEAERAEKEKELAHLGAEETRLNDELAQLMKDRTRLKESTQQLKEALAELSKRKAEADRRVAQFRSLLAKFKSLIDAGKLQVKIVDGRMVLALPTDVLFASGSAKLSKEGEQAVSEVAKVLKNLKKRRFQVEGHTDNVPIKTAQYPTNWELAAARALGVVKAMDRAGMKGSGLSAASYGEYRPAATNKTEDGRKENRRIEIVLVPDLSSLPGFSELENVVKGK
ncbi:MAG: OmpA family protein [Myxococcales bacterium]|nr:OmpA family protein [Myxococcales bacterium]